MAGPNTVTTSNYPDRRYTAKIQVVDMANLANSQVLKTYIPHAFRIDAVRWIAGDKGATDASGSDATATLTTQINGTAVTGGVVTVALANTDASGKVIAGTTITGANTGAADTYVGVTVSGVSAFATGNGYVEFTVVDTSQGAMSF